MLLEILILHALTYLAVKIVVLSRYTTIYLILIFNPIKYIKCRIKLLMIQKYKIKFFKSSVLMF